MSREEIEQELSDSRILDLVCENPGILDKKIDTVGSLSIRKILKMELRYYKKDE